MGFGITKMGYFNPIFMGDLVEISNILLRNNVAGIFNVTSDERISKYDFAIAYAKFFNLPSDLIKPFSQKSHPKEVRRPSEMTLSNKKLKNTIQYKVGSLGEGFSKLREERERSNI